MVFHFFADSWKAEFVKTERKKLLNYKSLLVKSLQPKIYCPFAGYFVEAHPSDKLGLVRVCAMSVSDKLKTKERG